MNVELTVQNGFGSKFLFKIGILQRKYIEDELVTYWTTNLNFCFWFFQIHDFLRVQRISSI